MHKGCPEKRQLGVINVAPTTLLRRGDIYDALQTTAEGKYFLGFRPRATALNNALMPDEGWTVGHFRCGQVDEAVAGEILDQ